MWVVIEPRWQRGCESDDVRKIAEGAAAPTLVMLGAFGGVSATLRSRLAHVGIP